MVRVVRCGFAGCARNNGQGIREGSISFYIFGAFFFTAKLYDKIKQTIFIRKVIRNNNNKNLRTYLQFDSC